jgi:hypothetical protein
MELPLPQLERARRTRARRAVWIVVISLLTVAIPTFFHHGALLDPIPLGWSMATGTIGFTLGVYIDVLIGGQMIAKTPLRGLLALFIIPLYATAIGTYCGRLVFETVAFAGAPLQESAIRAPVIGKGTTKYGGHGATIRPGARDLNVRIDATLYGLLEPYRAPDTDCLLMDVQTNRDGVRRTELPAFFDTPWSEDRRVPC